MCGVIGYVGEGTGTEFFFNGLKRLEYRGYDSAGIAARYKNGEIFIERSEGKLTNLEPKLKNLPHKSTLGIGHTRWATHGKPTENNAHPHRSNNIVLLHNGIIENYSSLKNSLQERGYTFKSETDTEVAVHLLNWHYEQSNADMPPAQRLLNAIFALVKEIRGAFAFAIMCKDIPDTLYAVKLGSPLVIGYGQKENYLASGITALIEHTNMILVMEDHEIAAITANNISLFNFAGETLTRQPSKLELSLSAIEKCGYRHFMLKEIYEHPQAVAQTIGTRIERDTGKINLLDYGITPDTLKLINRIQLIACGTSYYAALLGKYYIELFTKIPVEIDLASEYRYRTSTVTATTLAVAISQSGETADTLQAIKFAKANHAKTHAIVNSPESSIAHACDTVSLLHAGPEIGVASTKVFSAQIVSLYMLGLAVAQIQATLTPTQQKYYSDELLKAPSLIEQTLELSKIIEHLSHSYCKHTSIMYIGRGYQYPIALEGALKLKELSYIHAEAYAGGELKHGPIALIDENFPVICLAPKDDYYEKTISNIQEILARGAKTIIIGTKGDLALKNLGNDFIEIPEASPVISPFATTVIMHLLGYWIAVRKGTDIDQPRNLAKSVTVE